MVYDHGQRSPEKIEDITVFKSYSIQDFPKKKYLKIIYSIFKALRNANADIYFIRSGRIPPAVVALYCFLNRKKFVYSFASDMDVDLDTFGFIDLILFKFVLNKADLLLTHTQYQKTRLKEVFGKDSHILKHVYDLKDIEPEKNKITNILWVSTIRKDLKNPELYLKLAKEFPDIPFIMVGGPDPEDPEFYDEMKDKASKIPNLDFVGYVPYSKIDKFFSEASVFVNTSSVEGFPNTFIQAWENYTPVLSLNIDPDEIICNYNLGFRSKNFKNMVKDLEILINDENLREVMGKNGRRYVEQEHDINVITAKYKKLLQNLIEDS